MRDFLRPLVPLAANQSSRASGFFFDRKAIMKLNLPLISAVVLALAGLTAQAAGFDLQAIAASHADVLAGLSSLAVMGAVRTQGTDLYVLDPANNSVLKVGCVTSVDGIDTAIDQIETTCLEDSARSYDAGLATPGTATFGINVDPKDASHLRLHQLKVAGTTLKWALGWSEAPNTPPTLDSNFGYVLPPARSWIEFDGFMNSFPFSFQPNAVVQSTVGIQVSGEPVLTAAVV
jgi:hypothetical protein